MAEGTAKLRSTFDTLASVDVGKHVEKKNGFSYLSWPFAISEAEKAAPDLQWEIREWPCREDHALSVPYLSTPLGYFVEVTVRIGDKSRSSYLPVMDHKNQAIMKPTVNDINKAHQRALVKAIALHGLGLNLYAGEDLPLGDGDDVEPPARSRAKAAPKQDSGVTIGDDLRKAIGVELDRLAYVGSERKRIVVQHAAPDAADSVAGMTRALEKLKTMQ